MGDAQLTAVRLALAAPSALVALRTHAAPHLAMLPTPLGFHPRAARRDARPSAAPHAMGAEVKDELNANAARREELRAKLAAADAPPPLLHPEMAELYHQKVTTLAQALERSETRTEATEALRGSSTPSS